MTFLSLTATAHAQPSRAEAEPIAFCQGTRIGTQDFLLFRFAADPTQGMLVLTRHLSQPLGRQLIPVHLEMKGPAISVNPNRASIPPFELRAGNATLYRDDTSEFGAEPMRCTILETKIPVTTGAGALTPLEPADEVAECRSQTIDLTVYAKKGGSSGGTTGWIQRAFRPKTPNPAVVLAPARILIRDDEIEVHPEGFENFSIPRGLEGRVNVCARGCEPGPATLLCLSRPKEGIFPEEPFSHPHAARPADHDLLRYASRLKRQGFACETQPTSQGATLECIGRLKNEDGSLAYPLDVAILVPPGYHAKPRAGAILHLMGYNQATFIDRLEFTRWFGPRTLKYKLSEAPFREFENLAGAQRDQIMIVPHTQHICDQYEADLAEPAKFDRFIAAVARTANRAGLLPTPDLGALTLAAQSGSYRAVAAILSAKTSVRARDVREVYLFDSIFGRVDDFARWIQASSDHRFWSGYVKGWSEKGNHALMDRLKASGTAFAFDASGSRVLKPEERELRSQRIGFFAAEEGQTHLTIFGRYFSKLLSAGHDPRSSVSAN